MSDYSTPANRFVHELSKKFPVIESWDKEFSLTVGRKFTKIIRTGSVYAFVNNETHELIKAASWAKPASNCSG